MVNISNFREMQIKTTITSHQSEWPSSRNNKCWRGYGENKTFLYTDGNTNWHSYYREWCGESLKT